MKAKIISVVFLGLFFTFAVLVTASSAANISGAIFTTLGDGTGVNINLYDKKCDVFLNGGPPPNAPCTSAGLDNGCYVFQVTAPPGGGLNETLLSQDSITKRFIKVSGGVFVHDDGTCAALAPDLMDCAELPVYYANCEGALCGVVNTGSGASGHNAGLGKCNADISTCSDTGNISVRLMPYYDTPNPGGVYKVYATKVEDYDNTCVAQGSVFGFIHDNSKTDNFRVKPTPQCEPTDLCCLHPDDPSCGEPHGEIQVLKFCDANANGILDLNLGEALFGLSDWQINFTPDPKSCSDKKTDVNGLLDCPELPKDITYSVSEEVKDNFTHTATCVDGPCGYCSMTGGPCNSNENCPDGETCIPNPVNSALITITDGERHYVDFGNVGLSTISGRKFNDTNQNGIDDTEPGIAGVKVLLSGTDANGSVTKSTVTGADGNYSFSNLLPNLLPGSYTVSEVKPAGTVATTPTSCDISLQVDTTTCAGASKGCSFGNVCLGAGGGLTLGFWSNTNGQAVMNDPPNGMTPELCMLTGLNLRNASGGNFDPCTINTTCTCTSKSYSNFRTWLLGATATNMAYMLSAQLSAMELNVEANFVSGGAVVYALGCGNQGVGNNFITINALMAAANTSLGTNAYTLAPDGIRAYQECLKNALDKANNNRNFVVLCPSFTATCP